MNESQSELSDEELMIRYQNGDYAAFECLYRRHSGRILRYLSMRVQPEIAKDLLQEVFMKIHRSREQYIAQYPVLPWLFTVTRNALIDFFKKAETRAVKVEINDDVFTKEREVQPPEEDLSLALSGLPVLQRRAIELRYMNEWSFEKIAEELKTSPENSRQIISRGMKKMRALLHGGKR